MSLRSSVRVVLGHDPELSKAEPRKSQNPQQDGQRPSRRSRRRVRRHSPFRQLAHLGSQLHRRLAVPVLGVGAGRLQPGEIVERGVTRAKLSRSSRRGGLGAPSWRAGSLSPVPGCADVAACTVGSVPAAFTSAVLFPWCGFHLTSGRLRLTFASLTPDPTGHLSVHLISLDQRPTATPGVLTRGYL